MNTLTIASPDDMHVHLRDDEALSFTVPATARVFQRAIVMPNLKPAVTTVSQALAYRDRILGHVPPGCHFTPLMTLYLNSHITVDEIILAKEHVIGLKLYPHGCTTNAEQGVGDLSQVYPVIEAMQATDIPLLIHGEAVGKNIDIFDRESVFIENQLKPLMKQFPRLRVVLEHITTKEAVEFVMHGPAHLAATITAHHLMYDRNDMLEGGIKPHFYCMPILKRNIHRETLIKAATSGNPRFFLGTDSAPHARNTKESPCGCAGVYSAPNALAFYAEVFEAAGALEKLEGFASHFGADFYRLKRNTGTVTLVKRPQSIPTELPYIHSETIVPMGAGGHVSWHV